MDIAREFFAFLGALVMLAVIATLVSKNANTTGVINSGSSFVNTGIATAEGPVSGYSPGEPIYDTNMLSNDFEGIGAGGVL